MKLFKKIISFLKDSKKLNLSDKKTVDKIQNKYKKKIACIQKKSARGEKIKIGFSVVFDSVFPSENLYKEIIKDDRFSAFIFVIPYTLRGLENMFLQMEKTYNSLKSKYDNVYSVYDEKSKKFKDFSKKMDFACFSNPYDSITMKMYSLEYYAQQGVMPFYFTYGYTISNWCGALLEGPEHTLWWKYYVENQFTIECLKKNLLNQNNFLLSGYVKMDNLAYINKIQRERKKIIIAPHHTILAWENGVNLGTFLDFADFYLMLFSKYPDIDFVFRPHSLLPVTLERDDVWGKEKTDEYFNKLQNFSNVEYQKGGDYLESFVNSDALIHDCGSFMAEYLFTENPACYIIKDKQKTKENFNAFGLQCLEQHYQAFSEEDIINFIENTVLKNNDPMKKERQNFAENVLKINYPNVTTFILNDLRKAISCSKY